MTRQDFLKLMAAGMLPAGARPAAVKRPNIVFILTDDQGYGDLGCHGNPRIKTPHINRLHSESTRFTDFHASPTCAPTRASLMTGRHEFKSGVTHTINERERLSLKAITIAQVLKSAGYATGIFGKWHLGDAAPYQPNRRGFDEVYIHGCGGIGQTYPGTCGDAPGNRYFNPALMHNGKFEKTEGYCTDLFFRRGLDWIGEKRKSSQPFFAYIATNAPHAPLDCPEGYQAMYKDLEPNVAKFFGMITNIDDNVGKVMTSLKQWGIERDTLLIFMTDNGGTAGVRFYNAGLRGNKGTPYQGGTRVPAFFRWPGVFEPGDVDKLTAHIDFLPTFAELAGARIPAGVKPDGRSLVPLLRDHRAAWADRHLFTHVGRWEKGLAAESKYIKCSVRNSQYTMVRQTGAKPWELYDLKADPGEKADVAGAHPDVMRELNTAYDQWWAEILPCLENEDAMPPAVNPYKVLFETQYGKSS